MRARGRGATAAWKTPMAFECRSFPHRSRPSALALGGPKQFCSYPVGALVRFSTWAVRPPRFASGCRSD